MSKPYHLDAMEAELIAEIGFRERLFPRSVSEKRMTKEAAEFRLGVMRELRTLVGILMRREQEMMAQWRADRIRFFEQPRDAIERAIMDFHCARGVATARADAADPLSPGEDDGRRAPEPRPAPARTNPDGVVRGQQRNLFVHAAGEEARRVARTNQGSML